nr:MAG TPA: immunity protein [Caudoviricetes sp.]
MDGDTKQENSLASELLHEVKATSKRWFVLFLITILLLFGTNMAWLYAWNLPSEETTTEITSDNGSNANYIDGVEDITNGGVDKGTQD